MGLHHVADGNDRKIRSVRLGRSVTGTQYIGANEIVLCGIKKFVIPTNVGHQSAGLELAVSAWQIRLRPVCVHSCCSSVP